jgi:hypothetical protein
MPNLSTLAIQRTSMLNGINGIGKALKKVGLDPFKLNAESILKKARKKAGFTGILSAQTEEGLRLLIQSINEEAELNPFGKLAVKGLLDRTLYGRMKVEQMLDDNPDIEKSKIKQPVFIIGMPRTGTTILHAMMHEDSAHRSPLSWECLLPFPVPTPETFDDNKQLNTVRKEFAQLFKLVPDFQKKHYMAADSPQECLSITALDFNSFQFTAQSYNPAYMNWFAQKADKLQTMRFHKRFLQYLQSSGVKSERWLLKSPVHLMRLSEIFEVYPDAKIIVTHREPVKIVASVASLISSVRSLYSDKEDPVRTAREQMELWSQYFDRFLESRTKLQKEDQIFDIRFEDFAKDQIGTVKKIYENFNWNLTDETIDRFKQFLHENPRDKNGLHHYDLEDFDLTPEVVNSKFEVYNAFLEKLNK